MQRGRHLYIPLLLLALFLTYHVGITMFSHVHYINGVMIVHSHPSADIQHSHTEGQILSLAQVSSFVGIEMAPAMVVNLLLPLLYTLEGDKEIGFVPSFGTQCISLRAPPAFS